MDNDKLDLDELERVATAFRDDDQSFVWNRDDFCNGVLALITAARRPALPDREAVARVIDDIAFDESLRGYALWGPRRKAALTKADEILAMFAPSPAQAESEGWVLVPGEPTEAMVEAGLTDLIAYLNEEIEHSEVALAGIYRAMLSAAPKESSHDLP